MPHHRETEASRDVEMLSHREFERLRLQDFLIGEMEVEPLANWEYLGRKYVGEKVGGFTEFLRLESSPDSLSVVSVDLSVPPQTVWDAILARVGLPVSKGMSPTAVEGSVGLKGRRSRTPNGRTTMTFMIGTREPYQVACTFHGPPGLSYVTVIRSDVAPR